MLVQPVQPDCPIRSRQTLVYVIHISTYFLQKFHLFSFPVVCVGCIYAERLRGCKGDSNAGVGYGHEYMGGTCGSGIASSADDMLGMSVMHGMRGVGRMC